MQRSSPTFNTADSSLPLQLLRATQNRHAVTLERGALGEKLDRNSDLKTILVIRARGDDSSRKDNCHLKLETKWMQSG